MTEIEAGYARQGYQLPAGMTWEAVEVLRARYKIGAIYVPVALAGGDVAGGFAACAWGVPMIDGKFLSHDCEPRAALEDAVFGGFAP